MLVLVALFIYFSPYYFCLFVCLSGLFCFLCTFAYSAYIKFAFVCVPGVCILSTCLKNE